MSYFIVLTEDLGYHREGFGGYITIPAGTRIQAIDSNMINKEMEAYARRQKDYADQNLVTHFCWWPEGAPYWFAVSSKYARTEQPARRDVPAPSPQAPTAGGRRIPQLRI